MAITLQKPQQAVSIQQALAELKKLRELNFSNSPEDQERAAKTQVRIRFLERATQRVHVHYHGNPHRATIETVRFDLSHRFKMSGRAIEELITAHKSLLERLMVKGESTQFIGSALFKALMQDNAR